MAYQVNGNVVIDDSGNGTFDNLPVLVTPSIVDPAEDANIAPGNVTLTSSDFSSVYPYFYASRFEVANVDTFDSANIVYDSGNIIPGANSTLTTTILGNLTLYARVTHYASPDIAVTSATRTFTTQDIPVVLGQPYGGGIYTGLTTNGSTCYYLIVSSSSACCIWKTTLTTTSGGGAGSPNSCVDGYLATYFNFGTSSDTDHPAGNWTATRTINGFTDWYMPARDEAQTMYTNAGSLPAGQEYVAANHWTSTQSSATTACYINFGSGGIAATNKRILFRVRPVRRIPIA